MGDRSILGSAGSGFGSVSTIERLDANSVATQQYSEPRTITSKDAFGATSTKEVFLTKADAETFDRWEKPNVSVNVNGTTAQRIKAAITEFLEGR